MTDEALVLGGGGQAASWPLRGSSASATPAASASAPLHGPAAMIAASHASVPSLVCSAVTLPCSTAMACTSTPACTRGTAPRARGRWRAARLQVGRVDLHLVTLTGPTGPTGPGPTGPTGPTGTIAQTTELTDTQRELLRATAPGATRITAPTARRAAWAHTHKLHKVPRSQQPCGISAVPRADQLRNSGNA